MRDMLDDILADDDENPSSGVPLGTPPDLVFDDEPIEALLYGECYGKGPTEANIFAVASEAWNHIRKALEEHSPDQALVLAQSLVREGNDVPRQMQDELVPIWDILETTPSPHLDKDGAPAQSQDTINKHLRLLVDLGFCDFVHGNADRLRRSWQLVAGIYVAVSSSEVACCQVTLEIANWWQGRSPERFPGTATVLRAVGWEVPGKVRHQSTNMPLDPIAEMGLRSLLKRYRSQGSERESRQLLEITTAASAIFEAAGPRHIAFAACLNLLLRVLQGEREIDAATALCRHILSIREEASSDEHPNTIAQLDILAGLLCEKTKFAEAETLYRRTLEVRERILGFNHPESLQSASNLADLLENTGRFEESVALRQRTLTILERIKGLDDPETLTQWNNFAYKLRKHGWPSLAEPIDRKTVLTTIRKLGEFHPLTIHRRNNLVLSLIMTAQLRETADLLDFNWRLNASPLWNTTPRICYLQAVLALLTGQPLQGALARLKTLLAQNMLQETAEITVPWGVDYFVEAIRSKMPASSHTFLLALTNVIKNPAEGAQDRVKELEKFAMWEQTSCAPEAEAPHLMIQSGENKDGDGEEEPDDDEEDNRQIAAGKVTSVNGDELRVLESDSKADVYVDRKYVGTDDTEYVNVDRLSDLKEGDNVVMYYVEESGQRKIVFLFKGAIA